MYGAQRSQVDSVLPRGTNEVAVLAETDRLNFTHFVVYTRSTLVEQTTPVALSIFDEISRVWNITFVDDDLDIGEIGGTIEWLHPPDATEVTHYRVYIAESPSGIGRSQLGVVLANTTEYFVHTNLALLNFTHFVIYAQSSLVEQTTPRAFQIADTNSSVSDIGFIDKDCDEYELGGDIYWQPPPDIHRVLRYRVYLSQDEPGAGRSKVGEDIIVGTEQHFLPPEQPTALFTQIVIYTESFLDEQTTPVPFAFHDTFFRASDIEFPDFDLDLTDLGGLITWQNPGDISQVTHYVLYWSTLALEKDGLKCPSNQTVAMLEGGNNTSNADNVSDTNSTNLTFGGQYVVCSRTYYTNTTVDVLNFTVPVETAILDYTHILVYALSSLVEQTTPQIHLIFDAYASVSEIAFTDKDLDETDLGGLVTWTPPVDPESPERVVAYVMYYATSAEGAARSQIEVEVPYGVDNRTVPTETPLVDYNHWVVYTRSSLVEQTTPVSLEIVDNIATVSNITFPDFDQDETDLGGLLSWTPPADEVQTTHYITYFARVATPENDVKCNESAQPVTRENFAVCYRVYFGNTSVGVENITVPTEFALLNYTHIIVYTLSNLVEQTTPDIHLIFDAVSSVSDIQFTDKDLDPTDIGGLVTWTPPPYSERVAAYLLYMTTDTIGGTRSQVEVEVPLGTNERTVPPETMLVSYNHFVVYTRSSLVEQTTPVFFELSDTISKVTDIEFPDHDLDATDLGGTVVWREPEDTSQVTHYVLYYATLAQVVNGTSWCTNEYNTTLYGEFSFEADGLTVTQVEAAARAALEQILSVSQDYILVTVEKADTQTRRLSAEKPGSQMSVYVQSRRLAAMTWTVHYAVTIPLSRKAALEDAVELMSALGAPRFEATLRAELLQVGWDGSSHDSTFLLTSFSALGDTSTYSPLPELTFEGFIGENASNCDNDSNSANCVNASNFSNVTRECSNDSNDSACMNDSGFSLAPVAARRLASLASIDAANMTISPWGMASYVLGDADSNWFCPDGSREISDVWDCKTAAITLNLTFTEHWSTSSSEVYPRGCFTHSGRRVSLNTDPVGGNATEATRSVCRGNPLTACTRTHFGTVPVGTTEFFLPQNTPLLDSTHIIIYTLSSLIEQTTPEIHMIYDAFASISGIEFTDNDLDVGDLGGLITWQEPTITDRVVDYLVYMSERSAGLARSQIFHELPLGTNQVHLLPETPLADYTNFVIYTRSSLAEQTTPVAFDLSDTISYVSNITFPDFDLDKYDLGGDIAWLEPDDTEHVTHYLVYFSEDAYGKNRLYFGNTTVNVTNITVPVEFPLLNYTHIVVYTMSLLDLNMSADGGVDTILLEQTTPISHLIFDYIASVSDIIYTGKDLDLTDLGGIVEWTAPADLDRRVDLYRVYFAHSADGANRSQIEHDLMFGSNEVLIPPETPRSNWTDIVVYTESRLVEQTTPVNIVFNDTRAKTLNISFLDYDLDIGDIAGDIYWLEPQDDLLHVTHYLVYLADTSYGANRTHLGTVPVGTNTLFVPINTTLYTWTYITVYAQSSLVEQTTPDWHLIHDIDGGVLDIMFIDSDLDATELGGNITWTEPVIEPEITAYRVNLAVEADGRGRSQVGADLSFGTSLQDVLVETNRMAPTYQHLGAGECRRPPGGLADVDFLSPHYDGETVESCQDRCSADRRCAGFQHRANDGRCILYNRLYGVYTDVYTQGDAGYECYIMEAFWYVTIYSETYLGEMTTPRYFGFHDTYEPVQYMVFPDKDLDDGEFGGRLVWGPSSDFQRLVTKYMIYLATDSVGNGRQQFLETTYGTNQLTFQNMLKEDRNYMLVYVSSALAEQTTPSSLFVFDVSASASDVRFDDGDLDPVEIGGELTWQAPLFESEVTSYHVYLALGASGLERSPMVADVPVGTNRLDIQSQSLISTTLWQVVTCGLSATDHLTSVFYNGEDLTSTITGDFSSWLDEKTFSFVKVEGAYLSITAKCDANIVDASVTCGVALGCSDGTTSGEGSWEGYGSTTAIDAEHQAGGGAGWADARPSIASFLLLSNSSVTKVWGTMDNYASMRIASGPVTDGEPVPFTFVTVYTTSSIEAGGGEQSTPAYNSISDLQSVVTQVMFEDADLDNWAVGGQLTFDPPTSVAQVTGYNVYLAETQAGVGRSQIGFVESYVAPFSVPQDVEVGNFSYIVVYAQSPLGEQTTPAYQPIWNDFEAPCGSLPNMQCSMPESSGQGACRPSTGCSDCGLTTARMAAVEEAIMAARIVIIGSENDIGVAQAEEHFVSCSITGYSKTYYNVRNYEQAATIIMCRYSCLPDLTQCRVCRPPTDIGGSDASPDADGLAVWKYLACKYKGLQGVEMSADTLQYSYVFSEGRYKGTGTDVVSTMSCSALQLQEVDFTPFDVANLGCGEGCMLSIPGSR
eukprot:TRINITY_DN120814_c0_g1_i1.p1 TRINITY_DN120814_c0_g1~~TRINITY_DN120814_c0_g1_i1.p1  ORF type:complete len:2619 (+),score=458.28 TRINITY_DN120814_c0_g1_i1:635-7858(+)